MKRRFVTREQMETFSSCSLCEEPNAEDLLDDPTGCGRLEVMGTESETVCHRKIEDYPKGGADA